MRLQAIPLACLASTVVCTPAFSQVSVNCPMTGQTVLSGKSDISGVYRFAGPGTVYVEGNSYSTLFAGGTMSAQLFINGQSVSQGVSSNPGSGSDTKAVRTSTTIPVQAGQQYRIRLTSTNSNGSAVSDEVSLRCM